MNPKLKFKKPKRRLLLGVLIVVGLLIIGLLVFVLRSGPKLEATTYDNGRGQKFSLLYYPNSTTVSSANIRQLGGATNNAGGGANALVTPYKNGYRLAVVIGPDTSTKPLSSFLSKSLTIKGQANNGDVYTLANKGKPVLDFFPFTTKGKKYIAMVFVDYSGSKLQSTPKDAAKTAADVLANSDLTQYKDQLGKILGSIKAAN